MLKIDFSVCLRGSGAQVRNYEAVGFDTLAQWMQRGEEWDETEQPASDKSPRYTHKTFNGYLSSVFLPITKTGDSLRARPANPAPGYRNSANVVSRSLIMLDFDALPVGSLVKVQRELLAEDVLGFLYTTYNHLNAEKGGLERFRAIIVTDRPMEAGEISRASYAMFDLLREHIPELTADNASFNPAFAMYRPPANSNILVLDSGQPYSVDQLLQDFDDYDLQLPVAALTSDNWIPATAADMKRCEDWLQWADDNKLTVADGQIWVCCPMHERHSSGSLGDGTDGGAAILLPSAKKGEATFKCLHSHCDSDVNRNQRDTMLQISDALPVPIPEHLLPDPHGGTGAADRQRQREILRGMAQDSDEDGEPEPDDERTASGLRKRVRAPGAVDVGDLSHRIAGTFMIDIRPDAVERLHELSKNYVYVVQGGESRYYHRTINPFTKKASWAEWPIRTIRDRLANEEGIVGAYPVGDSVKYKTVSLFDALHHWPSRNEKPGGAAIFPPPTVCPPNMLNTWEGFAVDPEEGDVAPFLDCVQRVLCSGDKKLAHYFLQWLAHMFQHPGSKPGVAIVMRSGQGNGKGQLSKLLDRMMGDLFTPYNGTEKLTGQFNISLMTTLCAFIDEAKAKGQENATIKGLVTEGRALFEGKGSNQIKGHSFTRLIFASNETVMKVTKGDRRYCFLTLDARYAANNENPELDEVARPYWQEYSAWVNQDWVPAAVLHYLLNYDLTDFDEYNAPSTSRQAEVVQENLSYFEEWLLWMCTDNKFKPGVLASRPDELILFPNHVSGQYMAYISERNLRDTRTPMAIKNEFGRLMKRMNKQRHDYKGLAGIENRYGYTFASVDDLYFDICDALGVNPE